MSALEELVQSPRLPRIVEELRQLVADEESRRARFREEIRDDQKAEFISGEVCLHSPSRMIHSLVQGRIQKVLSTWAARNGGIVLGEKSLIALTRNDYEPDIVYFRPALAETLTLDQCEFPAPNLIVEVLSDLTAHRDRGVKFTDYAAHGVDEYWIVDADDRAVEQYLLEAGTYRLHRRLGAGDHLESRVMKGFVLPVESAFDDAANLAILRTLLQSPPGESKATR